MVKLLALVIGLSLIAIINRSEFSPAAQTDNQVARGKYLVEQVAMCIDCHTPRNERGELDRAQWLQGTQLDFKPVHPIPNWAEYAPPITNLGNKGSGWSEADAIKLLETGLGPNGKPLRPPMPSYKMSREDAAAVVAYLKSLKRARVK